jgi:hypothetical protein
VGTLSSGIWKSLNRGFLPPPWKLMHPEGRR